MRRVLGDADRVLVVVAACVAALVLLLASGLVNALQFDGAAVRTRMLLAASAVGPPLGVLLVLAAAGAILRGRAVRSVQVLSAVLVALATTEVVAYLTLDTGTVNGVGLGLGPKLGTALYVGATGLLAVVALWWTTEWTLSAGGSRPGGGSA